MAQPKHEGSQMSAHQPDKAVETIGVATPEPNGTIVLMLRAEGTKGAIGDAQFRYPPSHRD